MSRSFTIERVEKVGGGRVNYTGGRYLSESPYEAVRKMFTKVYHHLGKKGALNLKITVYETTQNSLHKTYTYKVRKVRNPTTVEKDGVEITYEFTTKVKALFQKK